MVQAQLKHFGTILIFNGNCIQFGERFARHTELGVTAGGTKLAFEGHAIVLSNPLANPVAMKRKARAKYETGWGNNADCRPLEELFQLRNPTLEESYCPVHWIRCGHIHTRFSEGFQRKS